MCGRMPVGLLTERRHAEVSRLEFHPLDRPEIAVAEVRAEDAMSSAEGGGAGSRWSGCESQAEQMSAAIEMARTRGED